MTVSGWMSVQALRATVGGTAGIKICALPFGSIGAHPVVHVRCMPLHSLSVRMHVPVCALACVRRADGLVRGGRKAGAGGPCRVADSVDSADERGCHLHACACVRMRARVRACASACVRVWLCRVDSASVRAPCCACAHRTLGCCAVPSCGAEQQVFSSSEPCTTLCLRHRQLQDRFEKGCRGRQTHR